MSIPSAMNKGRVSVVHVNKSEKPVEVGNQSIKPPIEKNVEASVPAIRKHGITVRRMSRVSKLAMLDENEETIPTTTLKKPPKVRSMSFTTPNHIRVIKLPQNRVFETQHSAPIVRNLHTQGVKRLNEVSSIPQRPRALSVGNVKIRKVKRSSAVVPSVRPVQ